MANFHQLSERPSPTQLAQPKTRARTDNTMEHASDAVGKESEGVRVFVRALEYPPCRLQGFAPGAGVLTSAAQLIE